MLEYASFGFVMLVWWTWPALWAIVVAAVYTSYRLSCWRDRAYDRKHGLDIRPCMVHMGTTPDGIEGWCWQKKGHEGPHFTQWGVSQEDYDVETQEAWENEFPPDSELRVPEPALIPEQPRLCGWGEDGAGNESACWKMAGHDGPHMVQDTREW